MKEINVNIPYSTFKHWLVSWFKCSLATDCRQAEQAIKNHWAILDSGARQQIIELCRKHVANTTKDEVSHFLKWCHENRNVAEVDYDFGTR